MTLALRRNLGQHEVTNPDAIALVTDMRPLELLHAIDDDVLVAARSAAERLAQRLVVGWWNDGAQRRFMVLPQGHHVTEQPSFLALVLISPTGRTESLAA